MSKEIQLSRGLVAVVDDEDFDWLSQSAWQAVPDSHGDTFYARRRDGRRMHREIVHAKPGQLVDHRNGNGLDNRKYNLRLCSDSQNAMNQKVRYNNKTGFKGVSRRKDYKAFRAYIGFGGRLVHLGTFDTAEQAAKAYDQAAIRYYGQFASTNFHVEGFRCANDQRPNFTPVVMKARILNGEKHPLAKLSKRQVQAIRYAFKSASSRSLAEAFNVGAMAIWRIRNSKSYQSI
jgi:hypothetical protein